MLFAFTGFESSNLPIAAKIGSFTPVNCFEAGVSHRIQQLETEVSRAKQSLFFRTKHFELGTFHTQTSKLA
jgi:hypothetical protein